MSASDTEVLTVGLAQIAPVWLDRDATLQKVVSWIERAAEAGCGLVVFGEAIVPGYPFWVGLTDGARFDSALQKRLYAHYLEQAVVVERGDLAAVQAAAEAHGIHVMLGAMTAPSDRGGHSVYCTLIHVTADGKIPTEHRKLVPTFEERLVWAPGDGHGLDVHTLGGFRLGGLNCWENWLPLARMALYGQGEDLHVALWPGCQRNTDGLTQVLAQEGRSYVISVSGLMRAGDVPERLLGEFPELAACQVGLADGGSCIAAPDGTWVVPPVVGEERLITATLDPAFVRRERLTLDVSGHYSRPDVLRLSVDRTRHACVEDRAPGTR